MDLLETKLKTKGFSLIELLVVLAIIGVIAAIAVPTYQGFARRTKIAQGVSVANAYIAKAKAYYARHGRFPPVSEVFTPELTWGMDGGPSTDNGVASLNIGEVSMIEYDAYPSIGFPQNVAIGIGFKNSFTGATGSQWQDQKLYFILSAQPGGSIKVGCGNWTIGHFYNLPAELVPANCTETDIYNSY